MKEEERKQYDKHLLRLVKFLSLSFVLILIGIVLVVVFKIPFEKLGPFGDFLAGSTVPVFTLVSSIGVILTLRMQMKQLEMQHEELQNSIVEMQETRKVMVEQAETMTLQRFGSTFFNMVNLHNTIIKSISVIDEGGNKITEREAFKVYLEKYRATWMNSPQGGGTKEFANKLKGVYELVYRTNEPIYGQYFRNLSTWITFVDTAQISLENKEMYMGIIKSQLSSIESTILIYHGISNYGIEILPIIRKYDLISGHDSSLVLNSDDAIDLWIFKRYPSI